MQPFGTHCTYQEVVEGYVSYLKRNYHRGKTVVLDGYKPHVETTKAGEKVD